MEPDDSRTIQSSVDWENLVCQPSSTPSHEVSPLDLYRKMLFDLHRQKSSQPFSNESEPHAAIVYEVFLSIANNYVKIFCERLKCSVFGQEHVVRALNEALARGVHVEVVTERSPDQSAFLEALTSAQKANLSIVQTLGQPRATDFNFCVVDDEAYRWEHDNKEAHAVGTMYRPAVARELSRYFEEKLVRRNEVPAA